MHNQPQSSIQGELKKIISDSTGEPIKNIEISVPEVSQFGHYSTNLALRLAREQKRSPLELATEFAEKLKASAVFSRVEAVAPGFINLWLSDEFLAKEFARVISGGHTLHATRLAPVVIDYSAPNIAKPMHVGHLRSTIIGDALANIHEATGHTVIRWNYIGDWGTQFGKLIAAYKMWGDKKTVEEHPIETLLALYVRFHEEMKTSPELETRGQEEFKKLEEGDGENRKLWEWFKDESLLEFDRIYKRLGTEFDIKIGESHYEEVLRPLIEELKEKGIAKPSEGGVIIHLEEFGLPVALIQKSDGASLYLTRDIASLRHRISKYKPAKILYVVANEQALHFSQLFAIAKRIGVSGVELEHIKFGMVLGTDGKKLSTREGKAVQLEDVVNTITAKALEVVKKNNPDMSEKEQLQTAEIVGIGALKYGDLKENRASDIRFDWERMLDLQGDSAPYLQYTAVRLLSIIKKAQPKEKTSVFKKLFGAGGENRTAGDLSAVSDEMKTVLMKKVIDYSDVVVLCAETNLTSHLAKYLFELSKLANQYYESVRILDDENLERRNGRLLLINSVAQTLTAGLKLLGIKVPERI